MADTATTPPASPTNTIIPAATSGHDNVGKESPQPANKPKTAPAVQKFNPAPKPRQEYPSRTPGKPEQQFRSQPDGSSRRKQFQPSTRAPAFVDFPVVIHDFGGGSARFDKLGPWHSSQLLCNVGAVRSIRPLPSGKRLIGCATEAQQSKLARLDKLPGEIPIGARIPRPVVEGVVVPIPMGGDELKLVRQDLEAGGHRVAGVVRLNNRKQEPSPSKQRSWPVRYGSVPHRSQYRLLPHRWDGAPSVRPLGTPSSSVERSRPAAPSAGKARTHTSSATRRSSPAWIVMAATRRPTRAAPKCRFVNKTYIPYSVAMQGARDEIKPKAPPPAQPASAAVDNCWSRDRTAPSSLSTDTGARGGTANRGPSRKNPINPPPGQSSQAAAGVPDGKPQSVAKGSRSKEVTALLARLDQLTRWERPIISPLESNTPMTEWRTPWQRTTPKGTNKKRRRRRKKKSTKGVEKRLPPSTSWS